MDAYTSSPAGTTYDDNGIIKEVEDLGPIGTWCTSGITSMYELFRDKVTFNENINAWDTSSVINMARMFRRAIVFNQQIDSWVTSSVTNMSLMFYEAGSFDQPIQAWNTLSVADMQYMFKGAAAFTQDLCLWKDAPAVNDGNDGNMFFNCPGGPNAGDNTFDVNCVVSAVTSLFDLFFISLFGCLPIAILLPSIS